jgi:hypothetical protein
MRQPALPEHAAATTASPAPPADDNWSSRLRSADAVYFSLTKSGLGDGALVWRVVQMMQTGRERVTLGWAEIPAAQQPLLEQWQRQEIPPGQSLDQLVRPERAGLLRQTLRPDLGQAALGCSRALLARIRDGKDLSAEDVAQLPTGCQVRPDAFDNFADRVGILPRLRRYDLRRLYRAHLVAEQTIAENIVRYRRDHAASKLLVFLPNDILIDPREIADFAGQKLPLRQLILDRTQPLRENPPQLLAILQGISLTKSPAESVALSQQWFMHLLTVSAFAAGPLG